MLKHHEQINTRIEGSFRAIETGSDRGCLTRQVREGVKINGKSDWHQPNLWPEQKVK